MQVTLMAMYVRSTNSIMVKAMGLIFFANTHCFSLSGFFWHGTVHTMHRSSCLCVMFYSLRVSGVLILLKRM